MGVHSVISQVIPGLRPKEPDKAIFDMLKKVKGLIKKKKIRAVAKIGGSFAKGTNLANDFDVDIFICFSLSYSDDDLSAMLYSILRPLKPVRVHGSRDYFQLDKGKTSYEFIPVLGIKETNQAKNVTDCSPLHTSWFLGKGKHLSDDVRLAKMFCKSAGVYGAESYIRGFSGHTLDILIVFYGGFSKLLKASQKWKIKTVIDPEKVHRGKALKNLNHSKVQGPLIVIDPIESFRNAASGLGEDKFHRFINSARSFLSKPHEDFFTVEKFDLKEVSKRFPSTLVIDVKGMKAKTDVVGSKILKIYEFMIAHLDEFSIIESGWEFDKKDKATLWFGVAHTKRKKEIVLDGPPLKAKPHVANFKKKHKDTFTKAGRIYAKKRRRLLGIKPVAEQALKTPHIKQRMKRCSVRLL